METTRQTKILGTIARVEKRLAKLESMSEADVQKKYRNARHPDYWHKCDIGELREQLAANQKKLAEAKRLDEKSAKFAEKKAAQAVAIENAPKALKAFADACEARWFAFYSQTKVRKERRDWRTVDEIARDCQKARDALILDFLARTEKKCGTLTDCSGLHLSNSNDSVVINGFVIGAKGRACVQSVLAGGYNIQCLHVRVLVK